MTSNTTQAFRDRLARLPDDARKQARKAFRLFQANPDHPSLRFKKVHSTQPIYSARVSRDYRVVGILDGDRIVWFWIGRHSEYEQLLAGL